MYVKTNEDWQAERPALLAALREFAALMKRRPFQNEEGLRGVSAFGLYWFIKQINPDAVFEVGVWKGFSTWLIEQAAPQAEVFCFDPIFFAEHLINPARLGQTYRSPRARYSYQDFSCAEVQKITSRVSRPLAFFDDHQNRMPRLLQCKDAGIKDILFDDNTADCYTHRTLEHYRRDPRFLEILEREVQSYEIFPALWPVDKMHGDMHIKEDGLGFPVERAFSYIHDEREWHSYLTHVRLR
jgi:hypothetical protein